MELMTGLEPVTSALPRRCTTDCATLAYSVFEQNFVNFRVVKFAIFYLTKAVRYLLRHISIAPKWSKYLVVELFQNAISYLTKAVHYRLCYISIMKF